MIFNLDNVIADLRKNGLGLIRCDVSENHGCIPTATLECSVIVAANEPEQTQKEKPKAQKPLPKVKRILKNGDYMTVLWEDGDKTIVKRAEDEAESDYAAFTAALGIKVYGSNSALKRLVASAEVQGRKKKKERKDGPTV